MSTRF